MTQDNSFEKNIDLQLHDIKIDPSEAVWNAVEKELDKKKRRYFLGWWLLPVLLVLLSLILGVGRYFDQKLPLQSADKILSKQEEKSSNKINGVVPEVEESKTGNDIVSVNGTQAANDAQVAPPGKNVNALKQTSSISDIAIINPGQNTISNAAKQNLTTTSPTPESDQKENAMPVSSQPAVQTGLVDNKVNIAAADSASTLIAKREIANTDTLKKVVKEEKKRKRPKWFYEASVAGGASSLSGFNFSNAENAFSYSPNNQGSPTTPAAGNRIERTKYNFKSGIYLDAGFEIGKTLSKRVSILSGLHYNLQSMKVNVNTTIDTVSVIGTTVSYTTISDKSYKEQLKIHAINIPVLLRLSLHSKININTGLYNNISISSNWDRYSNVLGKHTSYLPIVHLNPTFSINQFSVGPFVNAGLKKYPTGQRLMNYGLMLRYNPKK